MRFDQVGTQFPQRPTPIRLPDLAGRLLCQPRDMGLLAGRQTGRRAGGLQQPDSPDPGSRKRAQVRVHRIHMHALGSRNLQRAHPHAVEHQGLRSALLVAIRQLSHLLAQPANFARARATRGQWTGHGVASWSEARHSNND
jgi:hypothetical protein